MGFPGTRSPSSRSGGAPGAGGGGAYFAAGAGGDPAPSVASYFGEPSALAKRRRTGNHGELAHGARPEVMTTIGGFESSLQRFAETYHATPQRAHSANAATASETPARHFEDLTYDKALTRDIVAKEGADVKAGDFRKVGGGPTIAPGSQLIEAVRSTTGNML